MTDTLQFQVSLGGVAFERRFEIRDGALVDAEGGDGGGATAAEERRKRKAAEKRAVEAEKRADRAERRAENADSLAEEERLKREDIEAQYEQLSKNYQQMASAGSRSDFLSPRGEADSAAPTDVAGAVQIARLRYPARLHFLPKAIEAAGESNYRDPEKVLATFEALAKLGDERAAGPLGKRVEEWLREQGITYSPHESQTTMGMFGGERTYRYKNETLTMEPHIKIGIGPNPREHLRIHLTWHEEESRWIIGHVGRHLTNTKT